MLSTPLGAQRNFLSVGIALSAPLGTQHNFLSVGIALSAPFTLIERPKVVIFKIPTVRLWKHVLESSRQNLTIRFPSRKPWFYACFLLVSSYLCIISEFGSVLRHCFIFFSFFLLFLLFIFCFVFSPFIQRENARVMHE